MPDGVNGSAQKPRSFRASVHGRLDSTVLLALRKVRWLERCKSFWAPVTVLAVILLVYIAIVELSVCTYLWLQPIMKAVGLGAALWGAVLGVLRLAWATWEQRRLARHHAEELLDEVEGVANKKRAKLKENAWDELVERAGALAQVLPGTDTQAIRDATTKLRQSYDRHLAKLKGSPWMETGSGLGKALAIAVLVRVVFLEPYKIPSGSMFPTLEIGDQVFVNKFIYGVRLPFTNKVPFTIVRPPKRGDVIVFNNPVSPDKDYIKRIVAVGGDTLAFRGREVRVNGEVIPTTLEKPKHMLWDQYHMSSVDGAWRDVPRLWTTDDWHLLESTLLKEKLDGVTHWILNDPYRPRERDGEVTVPEGSVFVMGDNRDNSEDSRFGLGGGSGSWEFVPHGHIKGKATVIWLALGRGGLFSNVFGGTGFRTDRLFQPMSLCGTEAPPPLPR